MKRSTFRSAFFNPRVLGALLLCAAGGSSIASGTLLAFFYPDAPTTDARRTLTLEERVAYQRAIEEVYWRHRTWPKENSNPKPSLDAVMSQSQLEKKVADYLRKSQALEDYWHRPITAEQLQAEMDRMAEHTKRPEVLGELFAALGNDPFVIAECLGRPALAERLLTNWYAHDQRIHGDLRQRAEADLRAHPTLGQMKQLSGNYSEIELIRSDGAQKEVYRAGERGMKLNGREWDDTIQKLTAMFSDGSVVAGVPATSKLRKSGTPNSRAVIIQIQTGVLSALQEDEASFYVTAVIENADDRLKVATVTWSKEPVKSWLVKTENERDTITTPAGASYELPKIPSGECIDDTWTATTGAPEIRDTHTSVWTGSEMIVWGGYVGGHVLNTGGRYNPATDTWTATTTTAAPDARYAHTAVWTGSEMIVWGGRDNPDDMVSRYFNTGGRYNPVTDSWVVTSTTNSPSGRTAHTAVWTGSEMVVWGGYSYDGGSHFLNTGGRYNPATDSWVATNLINVPERRYLHTAVWTGSEMIVYGGLDWMPQPVYLSSGARYNPVTDTWIATSQYAGRANHSAVWTGSEMIIWGGQYNACTFWEGGARYDPGTDSWAGVTFTNAPAAREYHTAVWTGSEMIVWGGEQCPPVAPFNTGGRYNPTKDSWTATSTTNAPVGRAHHTAVWTGKEMIVWGGGSDLNTGGRYDPSTDSWTSTGSNNAPEARETRTAVWTGSETIIWGGANSNGALDTGGRYDPVLDTWTATNTTNAPEARGSQSTVWTGSEMIIWGGFGGTTDLNTGGRYNPISDSWTPTSTTSAPAARAQHSAVWIGSEMIVWGGSGCGGNCNLNSGGRYNPTTDTWTPTSTIKAPSARWEHTAVSTGSKMIVWGGTNQTIFLNSGGRYNPTDNTWTATTIVNAPVGRIAHTAVWTGSEMIVWGGGDINGNELNTGGRYNPTTDSWTFLGGGILGRDSHTAVWTGSEMIIWGGYTRTTGTTNTGGRYNPSTDNWTATSLIDAPIGRYSHTAVWTGSEMIVWGGRWSFGAFNTGGRYCAQSGVTPTPTPTVTPTVTPTPIPTPIVTPTATATATVTPTATQMPTATATPRLAPMPRHHPTPAPRP